MLLFCLQILCYAATACVNGKVSVSSNNQMMHPLTISSNKHMGVQHRYIMSDSFKKKFRGLGVRSPEAVRFFQSKGFKVP